VPEMLFNVYLCILSQLCAGVQVGEGADAETVWRMKLTPQELTTGIVHFKQL